MSDSTARLPEPTRLGRTALTVTDRVTTSEFYRDVVGLEILHREPSTTVLGVDETPLLELRGDETADARPRAEAGLYHNAFRLPTRGALGDALVRVRDGWTLDGASDHGVSEALYLTDPEGNGVELYRDRDRADWPHSADGGLRIGSEPLDLEALGADAGGESADAAPPGTTVGHIHLEVTSIDAARTFYAELLGFDVTMATPTALFLAAGGYHHHIGANTWNGRSTPASDDTRGLAWFEVVVPADDALESIRTRLENGGASVTETDDGLEVTDPDGNSVRLVSVP
ncbi:VOC family protein [Natronorubrum halophilum]|uniref:VOC family protein n=1 Tax=Natronorubrum halophilum TaxID=1702106 RepID=UPI000EF6E336|nr:VOC family protein [Natronorubrum halophilum]